MAPIGEVGGAGPAERRATDLLDPDARRLWDALPVHGTRLVSDWAAAGVAARDVPVPGVADAVRGRACAGL